MSSLILRRPLVTEKTMKLANTANVYTFEVKRTADKNSIKAAVETLYGVTVLAVNDIMRPKNVRRTGKKRQTVVLPKTKKALVKLKNGETIAVFDIGGAK